MLCVVLHYITADQLLGSNQLPLRQESLGGVVPQEVR